MLQIAFPSFLFNRSLTPIPHPKLLLAVEHGDVAAVLLHLLHLQDSRIGGHPGSSLGQHVVAILVLFAVVGVDLPPLPQLGDLLVDGPQLAKELHVHLPQAHLRERE